jgi:hypothetical protein
LDHGEDAVPFARALGQRLAGFFATKDHIEHKERLFSVFFLSAEALAKADVILRGYNNLKTAPMHSEIPRSARNDKRF